MEELSQALKDARSGSDLSLEAAGRAAKISPAYLHKLEAGRVRTPSPHVLRRLAAVLELSYPTLMELAGYLDEDKPRRKEVVMKSPEAPTNSEIVRLLEALRSEVATVSRQLEDLADRAEPAAD